MSWSEVHPGGSTTCARGDDFKFFVRRGTVNKLVFYLQGGGACFNEATCGLGTCDEKVVTTLNDMNKGYGGLLNDDPRSPVKDWHVVFVPYCTCDAHTGSKTAIYGPASVAMLDKTFHHTGWINAASALAEAKRQFQGVEDVFVTGCSAGSLGSYAAAPYVMDAFPDARHHHVADSFVPFFGESGWVDAVTNWDMAKVFQASISAGPDLDYHDAAVASTIVSRIANRHPGATFASYTSDHDMVQSLFYVLAGAGQGAWSTGMRAALSSIRSSASNFHSFIAQGKTHCMANHAGFYSTRAEGVALTRWYSNAVAGNQTRSIDYLLDDVEATSTSSSSSTGSVVFSALATQDARMPTVVNRPRVSTADALGAGAFLVVLAALLLLLFGLRVMMRRHHAKRQQSRQVLLLEPDLDEVGDVPFEVL